MAKTKEVVEVQRKLYTPKEVMQLFSISRPTYSDWARKKVFDVISIPGQRRTYATAESIDRLLSAQS